MRWAVLVSLGCVSCLTFPPATANVADGGAPLDEAGVLGDGGNVGDAGDDARAPLPPPKPACDPSAQPSASGVFVSTTGDDVLAGTRAGPVKTIGKALALAKAQGAADVYVEEGIYPEEVTIASATTIHGGWKASGATWSKDCADGVVGRTILRSTTARAITVSGFSGTAGVDMLTVTTKGQADAGQSAIAVFVTGASLKVAGLDVSSGAGGDGVTPPQPAQPGARTCNGYSDCSTGAAGAPGPGAAPASAGHFDATGWVASVGVTGQAGVQGENGTAGGAGQTADPCVVSCGASPSCASGPQGTSSGGPGRCGCGGLGGAGGPAGTSGGASIAILIVGPGALTIDHSNASTARGGNGAPGAAGGLGGAGTAGAQGTNGFCAGSCAYNSQRMACDFIGTGLAGGSPGGTGGAGGAGGQGSGGSGGPSYGIVAVQGATLAIDPTVAFGVGSGGKGAGGAVDGASGTSFTP